MRGIRRLLVSGLLLVWLVVPGNAFAAGGPAPGESCVPGTVWEDLTSGVKYICIYDELYGGTRWELISSGQKGAKGWLYRSSLNGCLFESVGLTGFGGGGGANSIARTYRWPCATASDRITQPVGELRSRVVLQRYAAGGWSTCRDSGYMYNTVTSGGWIAGLDMGASADCGSGSYRAIGFGSFFQASAWRGASLSTPSLWLP